MIPHVHPALAPMSNITTPTKAVKIPPPRFGGSSADLTEEIFAIE